MPARLRWQLTLSHLAAIVVTLLCMTAGIAVLATAVFHEDTSPEVQPAHDARTVAGAIRDMVVGGAKGDELAVVLRGLAGGTQPPSAAPWFGPDQWQGFDQFRGALRDIAYIVLLGPDGRVLATSDASGAAFSPPETAAWKEVTEPALAGERDLTRLAVTLEGGGPAGVGAYPIIGAGGRPVAAVLVAKSVLPAAAGPRSLVGTLIVFGAASVAVLSGAFVFALGSSSVVAYLLARRLVGRLERLGRAAESLAAGDLSRRVDEGAPDEVGLLARRFNAMAARLSSTMAELEDEKRRAEELLKAKRELVANVSHELRTPLASIRGHTESLLMRGPEPGGQDWRRYIAVIHRETEDLAKLIDDLFLLATTEADALPLDLAPVALEGVIAEVAESLRPIAYRERRITMVVSTAPDLLPVLADRRRVIQIVTNLARNALRYTPEGGLVSIQAGAAGVEGYAAVTVEDTGIGIPAEELGHVFERFYRGNERDDRAGAGLGLAIVRELTEAMGGTVSASSVPGAGSRFTFTLPFTSRRVAISVQDGS